jgi:tetratricopeptide (TPR) repeat protein
MIAPTAIAALAAALAIATGTVRAQDDLVDQGSDAMADDGPSTAEDRARALFGQGRVAFDDGDFETALDRFQRAYQESPRPALLYNLGLCHDRLRRDDDALRAYREFVASTAPSRERSIAQDRVALLEEALADEADTPTSVAPILLMMIGGAVAISGGILFVTGLSAEANVEDAPDGTPFADVEGDYAVAPGYQITGVVMLAAGAVTAGLGVVLLATEDPPEDDTAGPIARVRLAATGLVVDGTF